MRSPGPQLARPRGGVELAQQRGRRAALARPAAREEGRAAGRESLVRVGEGGRDPARRARPAAEDAARDGAGAGVRRRVRPVAEDAAHVVAHLTAATAGARRRARRVRRLARRRPRRRGSTGLSRARRALRRHRGSDGFKVEDESDVWVPHVSGSRERARIGARGIIVLLPFSLTVLLVFLTPMA